MIAPPTWEELDALAASRRLQILRRPMTLSIYTKAPLMISRILDLSIGDLDQPHADELLRAIVATALRTVNLG